MNKDYKKQVLEKIHRKEIFMYPKIYFIGRVVLIISLSILVFVSLVFCLSFVSFSIHESGEQFLLGFGNHGALVFLKLFPWAFIVSTVFLLVALEWMLRRFKFGYRLPMMRIFLYTLVITILASAIATITPFHGNLLKKADNGELPFVGGLYESIHDSHKDDGIVRGTITSIGTDTVIISHNDNDIDADDGTWTVIIPPGFDINSLHVGEKIYVAGTVENGNLYAYGIHELQSDIR